MWIDDQILANFQHQLFSKTFVPDSRMVVLGSGNDAATEINEDACTEDGVPVLKRYGGGGTVVLYPGTVVVSIGCWVKEPYQNNFYFKALNQSVISTLCHYFSQLSELSQAGISDIVFRDKKIAGTSLFRSRNYLIYQASIIVDLNLGFIERYLRHPSKEPDYRKGRSHGQFLLGLNDLMVRKVSPVKFCHIINSGIEAGIHSELRDHLIDPCSDQFFALQQRLSRSQA
jgi:lipoate---protein ligase